MLVRNLAQFFNTITGNTEVIFQPLYDTQAYTSAATVDLNFFQTAGLGPNLSNMQLAGVLPSPQKFLIQAVRFNPLVQPTLSVAAAVDAQTIAGALNDIFLLTTRGVLSLNVATKNYLTIPLDSVPAGGGIFGSVASTANAAAAKAGVMESGANGNPDARNSFVLDQAALLIDTQVNFIVNLHWAAAVTLNGSPVNLRVYLDGWLIRAVQ
jgi:hypothetical protein